ncbi:MAG: phosphate signaling complex protein PhoU [Myxococcaceae bacterium]|nr:phosphate signaling complex protein PhoU [Myxococcaceae bacterium]MCA3012000.1 phosphate signaling complex protein PhoU [Myxococcaceae bacterium]
MPAHTDRAFEKDLQALRDKLLAMGARVEAMIADGVSSLTERDTARARSVIGQDGEVNRLEVEVDDLCRRILALRQPAASDLRFITTALKIVTDLERVGDLAVNIAERAIDLNDTSVTPLSGDLPQLARLAQAQLKDALDAFVAGDADKAQALLGRDELLDALFLKLFNDLLQRMMEDSKWVRRATSLVFVAKHLERIGDHATNVAEMVIYMVRGTDVRHPLSRELHRAPTG